MILRAKFQELKIISLPQNSKRTIKELKFRTFTLPSLTVYFLRFSKQIYRSKFYSILNVHFTSYTKDLNIRLVVSVIKCKRNWGQEICTKWNWYCGFGEGGGVGWEELKKVLNWKVSPQGPNLYLYLVISDRKGNPFIYPPPPPTPEKHTEETPWSVFCVRSVRVIFLIAQT